MSKRILILLAASIIVGVGFYYGIGVLLEPATFRPHEDMNKDFRTFLEALAGARKLAEAGSAEAAERAFLQVLDDYKNNQEVAHSIFEPRFDLAMLYEKRGKEAQAKQQYRTIVEGSKSADTVVRARMELYRLEAHSSEEGLHELRAMFDEYKNTHEVCGEVCVRLADALIARGHYIEAADAVSDTLFSKKVSKLPVLDRLHELVNTALADAAERTGEPAKAAGIYVAHVEKHPGMVGMCWSWLEKAGDIYIRAGKYAQARNAFNKIIRDYPGEGGGQAQAGQVKLEELDRVEREVATRLTEKGTMARLNSGEKIRIVKGQITRPEKWSPAHGTYVVVGELAVRKGAELVIEPGTRVEFTLHAVLVVYGQLTAKGSADRLITFASAAEIPSYFDWDGVSFVEATSGVLDHVVVSHATKGVRCNECSPRLSNLTVTACGLVGIESCGASPEIIDARVVENRAAGLRFERSGGSVEGGKIAKNRTFGISIRKASKPSIVGTVIDGNRVAGVECLDSGEPALRKVVVSNNGGPGIHVDMHSAPAISDTEIVRNAGAGVVWSNGSRGSISGSKIVGNKGGIDCTIFSAPVIEKCTFESNELYGVRCESACDPQIKGNRFASPAGPGILILDICVPAISGNSFPPEGIAIRHEGEREINAADNAWPLGVELPRLVEDAADGTGKGKVVLP